jgi:NitT/TauT family transport system permease protein
MNERPRRSSLSSAARGLLGRGSGVIQVVAPLLAAIGLWELLVVTGVLDRVFFPDPPTVATSLWHMVSSGEIPTNLGITLQRALLGWVIGTIPAVVLGLLMGYFRLFQRLLDPLVAVTYPVPKLAILPLLLVLLGLGSAPIVGMAAILAFFPTLLSTIAGVRGVDRTLVAVVENFGGNRLHVFWKVILPGALPVMFAGFRLGAGIALEGTIAAEFVAASTGIGAKTWNYWQIYRIDRMYANLVVIALVGLLGTYALRFAEEKIVRWRPTDT